MARGLIILGCILIVLGVFLPYLEKTRLGKLPGDIFIKSGNFTFYFPLMTSFILSILLSLVLWFAKR